jgi:hypothetical protein
MQHSQKICEAGHVCDFCSASQVAKVYDAAPITFTFAFAFGARIVHFCDTKWTACAVCAELIDQDRWTELGDRTMETWLRELRDLGVHIGYHERDEIKEEMHRLHASFREAKGRTA